MKKQLLAITLIVALSLGMVPVAFADGGSGTSLEAGRAPAAQASLSTQSSTYVDYVLNTEDSRTIGSFDNCYYRFSINERSRVFAQLEGAYYFQLSFYRTDTEGGIGENLSNNDSTRTSENAAGTRRIYKHSMDLAPGTYALRVYNNRSTSMGVDSLVISSEPVVSLGRPSITVLSSLAAAQVTVSTSAIADALGYEYQFSTKEDFSNAKTVTSTTTTCTASGLTRGAYHYVRVRPYTVYNDGLSVYGNWSRAQAVYVKKSPNAVVISTADKTFKRSALKKKSQSFMVIADDNVNAKLTYKLVSVPAKAKSKIALNKSTGKLTVKKGIKKGTYGIAVKVSAAATSTHYGASVTKTITLKVV